MTDATEAAASSWDVMMAEVLENLRTAGPIVVQSYTAGDAAKVEAIPVVPDVTPSGEAGAAASIPDRPVWYPSGGGHGEFWPLEQGDVALGICSDRSLAAWQQSREPGEPAAPPFPRFHALDQMQVLPLCDRPTLPQGADAPGPGEYIRFGPGGTALRIKPDGTTTVQAPNGISSITMNPDGSIDAVGTEIRLAGQADVLTKAQALIDAIDNSWAAATPTPNDGGAGLKATFLVAWNAAKNAIKSTIVKVGG
jgi:hypothetical protein